MAVAMVVPASRWHRLITALLRLGCGLPAGRGPTRGTANSAHRALTPASTARGGVPARLGCVFCLS